MTGAALSIMGPVALHPVRAAATIHVPSIKYLGIMPVIVMIGGAMLLLAATSMVRRPLRTSVATAGTVLISAVSLVFALIQWFQIQDHGPYTTIAHAVVVDGFSVLVAVLVSGAMLLTALVGDGYLRREGVEGPEFQVLALLSASGAILMGQANDLIIVFLGLEILSIALYVLAAFNFKRTASGEAALKYFVLGAFSSAIFVYGIALTYGATGSTNLTQIADFLSKNVLVSDGVLLAGLALLLVGFGFKIAAIPFHMWTPDVYQGSPSPVTGFMAAVAKVGGFAALLRVFISSFGVLRTDWQPIVYALALLTLLGGAVLAVVQRDVKRMLAYSSINHAGFVLLGLEAATQQGVSSALYYLFAYTFMVIGTFAIVTVLGGEGDRNHDIAGYRGLAQRQPALALSLAVLLLAQAGAPFTTGLWAKLQVVLASVSAHSVPLAAVAMVSAAVAAFFYLRLAVLMYTPVRDGGRAGVEAVVGDIGTGELGDLQLALPDGDGLGAGTGNGSPGNGHGAHLAGGLEGPAHGNLVPADTTTATEVVVSLNASLLIEDVPAATAEERPRARVPVPAATAVAVGVCLAVTVGFGIFPAPLVDFCRHATLLFFPG